MEKAVSSNCLYIDPDVEFTRDFRAAVINTFEEIKEDMMTMSQQIGNSTKETGTVHQNQMES